MKGDIFSRSWAARMDMSVRRVLVRETIRRGGEFSLGDVEGEKGLSTDKYFSVIVK